MTSGSLDDGDAPRVATPQPLDADIIVIGAGAAGLWAAAVAAREGASVLVLEKTERAGTKILASGGTRCNLTTTLGPQAAAKLFGAAERFILPALKALPPATVRQHFHALGVPTVEEPELEKVFPASQRARDVRDALRDDALRAGVRIWYEARVHGLAPSTAPPDGTWTVTLAGKTLRCQKLLVCPGGQSYPLTGTTGDGYRWITSLGLSLTPPVPALVPLSSDEPWVHALSGIAIANAHARLHDPEDRIVARRERPVLFTHHGLSGPGAMDLSVHVAHAARVGSTRGWTVAIDLLPESDLDALRALLTEAASRPGAPHLARTLHDGLPGRILAAVTAQAGLDDPNPPLNKVDRRTRNRLADALKGLRVPVSGTLGWDKAEVTGGGLALTEVERTTLEVARHPGLYVFGELLDLTGPIGGLNFQAAFATANLAARHAARTLAPALR